MAKSEYLQREEAAKKQLGKKGVQKRAKQLPRAARATARGLLREVTGVDVSRRGVSVSPESLAMALPLGKVLKAAKALRAAGNIERAAALEARISMKSIGRAVAATKKEGKIPWNELNIPKDRSSNSPFIEAKAMRKKASSVYPKMSIKESLGIKPESSPFVESYRNRKSREAFKAMKRSSSKGRNRLLAEYLPDLFE